MSDNFTPTISDEQAMNIIARGVTRQNKFDGQRTLDYCKDAVELRGFNVRKLSQRLEARAADKGETFNSDSYQSNISNANGIMGLFDWNLAEFTQWLETQSVKSMSAIFKAFRELFTEPKAKKPSKGDKPEADSEANADPQPLIDVVLSALPHLTAEERQMVAMLIIELDTAADDAEVAEPAEPVAA